MADTLKLYGRTDPKELPLTSSSSNLPQTITSQQNILTSVTFSGVSSTNEANLAKFQVREPGVLFVTAKVTTPGTTTALNGLTLKRAAVEGGNEVTFMSDGQFSNAASNKASADLIDVSAESIHTTAMDSSLGFTLLCRATGEYNLYTKCADTNGATIEIQASFTPANVMDI